MVRFAAAPARPAPRPAGAGPGTVRLAATAAVSRASQAASELEQVKRALAKAEELLFTVQMGCAAAALPERMLCTAPPR